MEEHSNHPDFRQGYSSGVEGTERGSYESYLSSQVQFNWLSQRIQEKRDDLKTVEQKIEESIAKRKTIFDQLQDLLQRVSKAAGKVANFISQRDAIDAETDALQARRKQTQSEYSLLAGLFFFFAGLSFVFGDLIISHEIVAYALNIRNSNEAWAFAIGLAMISILLKPAYDRLIEKPYVDEYSAKSRNRYAVFKLILAGFAIITLGILGWFRYEAYRTDKLKDAINKSVKNLQLNSAPIDPSLQLTPQQQQSMLGRIESQLQKSDELNLGLVNSPWALASFVLSGILFALAGAVSLGMALPVLQNFWYRWLQIDPKLWRLRRRRKRVMVELQKEEQFLADETGKKDMAEHELSLLPSLDELRAERQKLRSDVDELIETTRLAQTDSRIAAYNTGYSKGEVARELMDEEEFKQFKNGFMDTNNLALKASASTDRTAGSLSKRGLRPHQLIRKLITDEYDGKE